ncbi:MAG: SusC/RagA family TonB-linked outer membrane protein [Bacteroidales bacterium]|nr:SusC/RagA family TonB-linked outer membrane protein [Bacteroidales bacterium]
MRKLFLLFFTLIVFLLTAEAQQKTVRGKVTGAEDNLPIAGAEVRFLGMKTAEVTVGSSAVYNIALEYDVTQVNEVVVVGYGTQIKSKVTGSIAKVDGDLLKNIPVPTVEQALQGKTAGVFIESVNGKSTGTTNMRIRGASSISATNQPLFVVDGIPLTTEALNQSGAVINPLTSINFNDVESIDILKDAASAAIYGSRGANGVVIITTKKGISGDTKLNFTIQSGFNEASHRREFLNTEDYIDYFREAAVNGDIQDDIYFGDPIGTSNYWKEHVEKRLKRYSGWASIVDGSGNYLGSEVDTDWQDQAFQRGKIFAADLSAQGGNDKVKYFTSLSYNNSEGILVSNGIEKISARLNVDNKVSKLVDLGFALSLNRTAIDQVSADNAFSTPMQLVALSPVTPVRDLDGNLYNTPTTTYYNGLLDVEYATRDIIEYRSIANGYLTFNLMDNLKWRNELGFDLYNLKENARYGEKTESGTGVNGYGFANYGQTQNLTTKSYLDFFDNIGDIGISAVLGTEFQYTTVDNAWAEGQEFPLDELKTLASAGLITGASSTLTQYSFLSYFTRVNLDYKAKYLLTISGRIDGSSRFGENNRYGTFPAASLGWVISKEDFLADNSTFSFLKLRTSFGQTGNAGISNFGHLGLYGVGSYNSQSGLFPEQIPNPDLGWETTQQIDAGIDFGFFKNRISGEIDYYVKKTSDLLLEVPVPATSGYSKMMRNVGNVENKGFELIINTNNLSGDLSWTTSFNFSVNKNKVTNLGDQEMIDNGSARYMNIVKVGQPIGVFYGAEYAGVDPANGDALWYINAEDASGNIPDPEATTNYFPDANFVVLGKPTPDVIGALTNTLGFKGIELAFTFQGVTGNSIHLIGDQWMGANGVWYDNQLKSQLASWKNPGDITNIPQARLGWDNGDQSRNSRYLSDGAYIKLRSLSLSYELPRKVTSKIKLDRMRLFIQGQNLLTFSKYEGWDPEVSTDFLNDNITSGCDFYSAPQPRSVVFGINIGL